LSALDALGNGYFAFAGEQGRGAHFAEIDSDRILRFRVYTRTEFKTGFGGKFPFCVGVGTLRCGCSGKRGVCCRKVLVK
jgi:hypothetical protein